jgi:hypothetical protein
MDIVDVSNLNRQILYAREDVGRRKVDAAMDGLSRHNLRTELVPLHLDATHDWEKVVQMARQSTVIFNAIDYGEYFDYAVTSLCASLGRHYVSASSYGHTSISENYVAVRNPALGPCWACNNEPPNRSLLTKLTPEVIQNYSQIDFLPRDTAMPNTQSVGSSILPVSLAAYQAVTAWINSLFGFSMPNWSTFNLRSFEHFAFPVEQSSNCLLCQWKHDDRINKLLIIPKSLDADILELYFGLPTVSLSVVNGTTYRYTQGCIEENREESRKADEMQRLQPLSHLGKEYDHIYVPCVPARDLNSRELMESTDVAFLDDQVKLPLIKTANGSIKAIQSGGRSAILPGVDHVYRLKGCGNFIDQDGSRYEFPGFSIQAIEDTENGQEIRGCAFKHTAERELFMSEKIGMLLAGHNLQTGNVPIGMYQYRIKGEPLPKVSKVCGIFQTIGEKRLASHLLTGLEILLPHFFPHLKLEDITHLFPPERVKKTDSGVLEVLPTWSACCTSSHPMQPVDLQKHILSETVPSVGAVSAVSERWRELWQSNCEQLATILPLSEANASEFGSLFAALYWRLGFEVGLFKRLLEDNNINWGYFIDHNQFEPHCNSHPNNFVVVPEVYGGNSQLLAAVDFDLSFTKEASIPS